MSFVASSRARTGPVLPLASMVDILFLLLIFFLTASAFREQEKQLNVALPGQETASAPLHARQTFVTITADGSIHIGDKPYTLDELRATLEGIVRLSPDEAVVVRADRDSRLGLTVRVIDTARAAGVRDVRLATTKPAGDL